MHDLDVIDEPAAAIAALDPIRSRILTELAEPGSASTVAATLGLPRQKVNYHLRLLEQHGLVELVEERPRRGLTERVVRATAGRTSSRRPTWAAMRPTRCARTSSRRAT